jgi:hypothetical protein
MEMKFKISNGVGTGYGELTEFILVDQYIRFHGEGIIVALLMLSFI